MFIKKYMLALLLCGSGFSLSAQSLNKAKELYNEGKYEEAKPAFKRLVRSQPYNGSYNLWYGVCCLKTNEPELAVKHLKMAVKRRTRSGQYWLGQAYNMTYQYEDAVSTLEDYIEELEKRKRDTSKAEDLLKKSRAHLLMLKGVEQVTIIDSIVTDKASFLKEYAISPESGKLFMASQFKEELVKDTLEQGSVFLTELENQVFYATRADSTLSIMTSNKRPDGWSSPRSLSSTINDGQNANYPFMMTDGSTIYYAADGKESMGGYDIFVTRSNNETFLTPENMGMPFNSPYNDYMYVVDEFSNLGWFASDRYQPEGKVCIYVFIPNTSKQVYDYDAMDVNQLIHLAQLTRIRDTWKDQEKVDAALERLAALRNSAPDEENGKKGDFKFIVTDQKTYYNYTDFHSKEACALFKLYQQKAKDLKHMEEKVAHLREMYGQGNAAQKEQTGAAILDLEKRLQVLQAEVKQAEINARNKEITNL